MSWPKIPLAQAVEFLDHKRRPVTENQRQSGDIPYYGANGLQGTIDRHLFDEPLLLLAEDGGHFGSPTKPIAYTISGKTWVNNHAHVLRARPGFDLRFLCKQLEFYNVLPYISGSTRAKLTKGQAACIPVSKPPLGEQKRIAAILDKADAIRRKREQAIQLADEFLRSLFLDMFGDPVRNPKGWPVCSLDRLTTIRSGVTKGRVIRGDATDVPYMRVANVQDGKLDLREIKSIAATRDEVDRYRLATGDILLTEGGDPDKLGRGTVWRGEIPNCIHQNHIFCIRLNGPKQLRPEFLSDLLASNLGKKYFLRAAKQTTGIASINKTQLSAFPVLVPPFEAQEQYRRAVDSTKTLLTDLESTLAASESFSRVLSQHAFRDGI